MMKTLFAVCSFLSGEAKAKPSDSNVLKHRHHVWHGWIWSMYVTILPFLKLHAQEPNVYSIFSICSFLAGYHSSWDEPWCVGSSLASWDSAFTHSMLLKWTNFLSPLLHYWSTCLTAFFNRFFVGFCCTTGCQRWPKHFRVALFRMSWKPTPRTWLVLPLVLQICCTLRSKSPGHYCHTSPSWHP